MSGGWVGERSPGGSGRGRGVRHPGFSPESVLASPPQARPSCIPDAVSQLAVTPTRPRAVTVGPSPLLGGCNSSGGRGDDRPPGCGVE